MLDWVRTSEEKISVSRDALSLDPSGVDPYDCYVCSSMFFHVGLGFCFVSCLTLQIIKALFLFVCLWHADGTTAFVTGIVLYRNLGAIISQQRYENPRAEDNNNNHSHNQSCQMLNQCVDKKGFHDTKLNPNLLVCPDSNSTLLNSKVVTVTVSPAPTLLSSPVEIEFPHLHNVSPNN